MEINLYELFLKNQILVVFTVVGLGYLIGRVNLRGFELGAAGGLCSFVEAADLDRVGVFRYSDDDTSESYHLDGKVAAKTSYNRQRHLMALQRKISRRRNRALVGQSFPILISGPSEEIDLLWEGRLPSQAEGIDGTTYLTDLADLDPSPGDFGMVRITKASDYDLFGELESVAPRRSSVEKPKAELLPVLQ